MHSLRPLALLLASACTTAPLVIDDAARAPDAANLDDAATSADAATPSDAGTDGGSACDIAPITITHTADAPTPGVQAHLLDLAVHPAAVCNDGSPGYFYFRRGAGGGAHRWLVYLEGGGSCGNSQQCADRLAMTPGYMTSSGVHAGDGLPMPLEGIKSADPAASPDFYDANLVQLAYCSSDAWAGDHDGNASLPTSDVGHWSFHGHAIVDAVIAEMRGLGLADGDEVLLVGSSAGGVGVFVNADRVREALGSRIRMLALPDAGFMIDYASYDPATMTESTAFPTARASDLAEGRMNWGGTGDASCEAHAGSSDLAHLLCMSPEMLGRGSELTTRFFIRQSQSDRVQIKQFIPRSIAAPDYRARWSAHMVDSLGRVSARHAVFSTADAEHGVVNDDALYGTRLVAGVSLPAAIGEWYRDPCAHTERRIGTP
jgi:hypothetical protein